MPAPAVHPTTSRPASGRSAGTRWLALRRSPLRHLVLLELDGAIAAASLWLAMLLRFEGAILPAYLETLPAITALLVGSRILANFLLRLHRWSFRFAGLTDATRSDIGSRVMLAPKSMWSAGSMATWRLTLRPGSRLPSPPESTRAEGATAFLRQALA